MEPEKKSNGALVGLVIIVIILVLGGIYVWKSKIQTQTSLNTTPTTEDANSINALEQDLKNTDTNVGVDVNTLK